LDAILGAATRRRHVYVETARQRIVQGVLAFEPVLVAGLVVV